MEILSIYMYIRCPNKIQTYNFGETSHPILPGASRNKHWRTQWFQTIQHTPFVWASRPCGPAGWLEMVLIKAGETNSGQSTTHKQVWICDICHRQIQVRMQIINLHTLIRKLLQTNILCTIIKFIANYINGRKAYTTYKTTHPDNVNLKLAFHRMASFHPHYLIFTLQTYHHPVHRFTSWSTQMTSPPHPHTQARVQPINIYNHTYMKFLHGQNKTISH